MFTVRDEVRVTKSFAYYEDWKDDHLQVVGVELHFDDTVTYTVQDDEGTRYDGMTEDDLDLIRVP